MGTTRQRQRLLINGLVTVFLLSLLGGCVPPPAQNPGGDSTDTTLPTTQPTTPTTTPATTPATTPTPDIVMLKKELAVIEDRIFSDSPLYKTAQDQLPKFKENFNKFSAPYQTSDNAALKPQIEKINSLLKKAEASLINIFDNQQQVKQELQPIFVELAAELNNFPSQSENTQNGTEDDQDTPGGSNGQPKQTQNTPPAGGSNTEDDRQSGLTFGQVIFANFLATGFTILLVLGIVKVVEEISNQRRDGRRKSNNQAATNSQANTLPQQNNLDSGKNIDDLKTEFSKLYLLISGIQDYSIKKGDLTDGFNSLQQTLKSIQTEIKSIRSSIDGSVGRTSSHDNSLVQQCLNQITSLNQEKENLRGEIQQLQQEKRDQSSKTIELQAQLNQLLNSHANAVSSVQYNQLEQRFNDLREEHETLKNTYNNLEQSIKNNHAANQWKLEERKRNLIVIQQELDQVNSALIEVTAERDGLQEKVDELEEKQKKLNRRQNINDNSYSTTSTEKVFPSGVSIGTEPSSYNSSLLTADIQKLISDYNQNPKNLESRKTATVDFTESNYDALRSGSSAILEKTPKSDGYLVVTSSCDTWLFPPDTKLKAKSDYNTLSALYECHQYQNQSTRFTLIKPAKVRKFGLNQWELIEKGELEFMGY